MLVGHFQQHARAFHVGGIDILGGVEGQGGGGMNNLVYAFHRFFDIALNADVALDGVDLVLHVGVVELDQIERDTFVPALGEIADEIDT